MRALTTLEHLKSDSKYSFEKARCMLNYTYDRTCQPSTQDVGTSSSLEKGLYPGLLGEIRGMESAEPAFK